MRSVLSSGVLAAALFSATSALSAPASINGKWKTQDKDAIVTIAKCGATLCGRISKFLVAPPDGLRQKDINNPNKSLRKRTLLGLSILSGFKADGKLWRGRIYDPKSGKSYRSVMYKTKSGQLKVKGCVGPFCQSQLWSRSR